MESSHEKHGRLPKSKTITITLPLQAPIFRSFQEPYPKPGAHAPTPDLIGCPHPPFPGPVVCPRALLTHPHAHSNGNNFTKLVTLRKEASLVSFINCPKPTLGRPCKQKSKNMAMYLKAYSGLLNNPSALIQCLPQEGRLVPGPWPLVPDLWSLAPGPWSLAPGPMGPMISPWLHGSKRPFHGALGTGGFLQDFRKDC